MYKEIDSYYRQSQGKWELIATVRDDYVPHFDIFWVDICHRGESPDRYYFDELAPALEFYREGWKEHQYLDNNGKGIGLDHKGLYSRGPRSGGVPLLEDPPEDEIKSLRQLCKELMKIFRRRGRRRRRGPRPAP